MRPFIDVMIVFALLGVSERAEALEVRGAVATGLRSASFHAAPSERTLGLIELEARAHAVVYRAFPTVSAGFVGGWRSLTGESGPGLQRFAGFDAGPEVMATHAFGPWSPFAGVSYRWGRYEGRGAENWGGDEQATYLLYGGEAETSRAKRYATAGVHATAGMAYALSPAVSVTTALALGNDAMRGDARVMDGRRVVDRRDTQLTSRALLVGVAATR